MAEDAAVGLAGAGDGGAASGSAAVKVRRLGRRSCLPQGARAPLCAGRPTAAFQTIGVQVFSADFASKEIAEEVFTAAAKALRLQGKGELRTFTDVAKR